MRTQGMIQADTPNPDGHIFIPVQITNFAVGTGTNVATAPYGVASGAAAATIVLPLSEIIFRYGVQDYAQEQWGSTLSGGAQGLATPPATFTTPYGASGNPPFLGASQLTPPTSRPKGILIKGINLVFQNLTTAPTVNSVTISKVQFPQPIPNGLTPTSASAAPVITTLLASAALSLALNTAGQYTTTNVPLLAANQIMLTPRDAEYYITWLVTAGAATTTTLIGVWVDVSYNLN